MLYEARFAGDDFFETDPDKMGWIRIEIEGKTTWARPCLPFGEFEIPTAEWIETYVRNGSNNNAIGIYVQNLNNSGNYVWMGFTIYKDRLPNEAVTNYSYRRVKFTENWKVVIDDKEGTNKYEITHSDGTKILVDRTTGSEKIEMTDGVHGNSLVMDIDGVKINGKFVLLEPYLDWLNDNKAQFGFGNLGIAVPIFPATVTLLATGKAIPNNFVSKNNP